MVLRCNIYSCKCFHFSITYRYRYIESCTWLVDDRSVAYSVYAKCLTNTLYCKISNEIPVDSSDCTFRYYIASKIALLIAFSVLQLHWKLCSEDELWKALLPN